MMRRFVPLLIGLLYLTSPNGVPLYIVGSQVIAVRPPVEGECPKCSHAVILTGSGRFSVRETPAEIAKQLEQMK